MSKIQDSGLLQWTINDAGLDTNTVLISEYSIKTVCDQTKSGLSPILQLVTGTPGGGG